MDIEKISSRYSVRRLTEADVGLVLALTQGNPLFYRHCPPVATKESILADMKALPPRTTCDDKYYLGLFAENALVAVIDLILNYPNAETAFIGFFMVAAEHQGGGAGSAIVSELAEYLGSVGYKYIRLGYVKGNPQSRAFWLKNKFSETGVETSTDDYTIVVLQRSTT